MITDKGTDHSVPMLVIILLSLFRPLSFFSLRGLAVTFTQFFQPLCFRNFGLHLHDEQLQFLLALLPRFGVHIAGVLLTVRLHRGVAPLPAVFTDLGDTAGAGLSDLAVVGNEGDE